MAARKDLLMLIEDAQDTLQRMTDQLSAVRTVLELGDAPVIGNRAGRVVAQQLINGLLQSTQALVDELTVITVQHGKENA